MRRALMVATCMFAAVLYSMAQEPAATSSTGGKSTLIGCLAGPNADDHYTLTSMQHRMGVEVAGGDELKTATGAKVKLTGSWEALPNSDGKDSRRFVATAVSVLAERCQAPSPTTPVSKKKAQEQTQPKQ